MYCVNNWKLGQCAVWRLPKWPEPTDWPGDDCATPNPPATTPNPQPTFPNPNPTTSCTHICTPDCPSRGQNQVKLNDNQVKSNSSQLQSRQTPTLTLNALTLRAFDCFKQARLVTDRLPTLQCAQCHTDSSLSVGNPRFITDSHWNNFAILVGRQSTIWGFEQISKQLKLPPMQCCFESRELWCHAKIINLPEL